MKAEFINDATSTRKKFFYSFCLALIISIAITVLKYFFDPEGQEQRHHYGRRRGILSFLAGLSYTECLVMSILIAVIGLFLILYLKIILRIKVDSEQNFLEIECIERFKFRPVLKVMKLSETFIQVEEIEDQERYSNNTIIRYYLHLTNKQFGYLKISSQDFKNIKVVCEQFQLLKETAAIKNRKMRLLKKPGRRSAKINQSRRN